MNPRIILSVSVLALLSSAAVTLSLGQPDTAKQPAKEATKAKPMGDPYTLATCPTSGKKLGAMGDPIVKAYDGREVRFCCAMCPPKFEKDLAASLATLDAAIVKDQLPLYPTDASIVSGKTLGAKPIDWVYNNRLVRLADAGEKAEFLKDPKKHLADLDKAAIQQQSKGYPLKTCPVSKEDLGDMGEAKDVVIGGRLIRLCCNDCKTGLAKDPAKFIAAVDAARHGKDAAPDKGGDHHADAPAKK